MSTVLVMVFGVASLLIVALATALRRREEGRFAELQDEARTFYRNWKSALGEAKELRDQVELARQQFERMAELESESRDAVRKERERADRYFNVIEGTCRERDGWQAKYYEESLMHGGAQQMMITTIHRLAERLRVLGQRVTLDPAIELVRQQHVEQHEQPAREGVAVTGRQALESVGSAGVGKNLTIEAVEHASAPTPEHPE